MMKDWRVVLGVMLGLCLAVILPTRSAQTTPGGPVVRDHGPLLTDCDGRLQELVIQYVPEAAGLAGTAYQQFLTQLPGDVRVRVVCPDQAAFDDLQRRVGDVACRLIPVLTGHPQTCWSRDRWVAFAPKDGKHVLLAPKAEEGATVWPERAGDSRIVDDLDGASSAVVARRSRLFFDGGDFVSDSETVFVTPDVIRRNVGRTVASEAELRRELSQLCGRRVVLLKDAPDHHAGMFMMLVGDRTALVADPSLVPAGRRGDRLSPPGNDFSAATQRTFDAAAESCAKAGYRVVRIPVVPGVDGRTYLSWVNVILDQRGQDRVVYLPVFRHAGELNHAAEAVWRKLGFEVRRVDCTETYVHFGTLRCLVNVLRRA